MGMSRKFSKNVVLWPPFRTQPLGKFVVCLKNAPWYYKASYSCSENKSRKQTSHWYQGMRNSRGRKKKSCRSEASAPVTGIHKDSCAPCCGRWYADDIEHSGAGETGTAGNAGSAKISWAPRSGRRPAQGHPFSSLAICPCKQCALTLRKVQCSRGSESKSPSSYSLGLSWLGVPPSLEDHVYWFMFIVVCWGSVGCVYNPVYLPFENMIIKYRLNIINGPPLIPREL